MNLAWILKVMGDRWNIRAASLLLLAFVAPAHAAPPSAPGFAAVAMLQLPGLKEISGLALSRRQPGLFWALNDSGNPAELYAFDASGAPRGRVAIGGAVNIDWEDLAAYVDDGVAMLAIADTGDNLSWRAHLSLYLLPEPAADAPQAPVAREIRFRFEDGPRDCEAMAVDLPRRRFLLFDKGRTPVGLYALDMDGEAAADGLQVARRIGDVAPPPASSPLVTPLNAHYRASPTGMSLSADGLRLLVLSYSQLMLYQRTADEDWPQVIRRAPQAARLPNLSGFEAAALSADGGDAWVSREGERAPLYRWTGLPTK